MGDDEDEEMKMKDEIVDKFIRNFHNGDYDVELDDKLSSDRGAIIAAYSTQASYDNDDNWQERNEIGLEFIMETRMPYWIDELGWGGCLCLQHEPNNNNEEPIVWHEPILDEYWEQIEEEIARKKQLGIVTEIGNIRIENVEMKKERVDALVDIFRSGRATNSITFLDFDNTNLCGEGIISLSKLVDVSSELQTFCLHHNWIDSMDSARCLSGSLKSHTRINKLHLDHCDLGSNPEMLSVILQSEVKNIYLGSNNIDSVGSVTIAEYLEGNPPIDRIDLDCNRLNDDDAILISQALKRNTNLSHLDLERNSFTSMGVKALLTCVLTAQI